MSSIGGVFGQHVVSLLHAADDDLGKAVLAPVWQAGDGDIETAVEVLDQIEARVVAVRVSLLNEAEQRGLRDRTGAPSTDRWLAERFRWSRGTAKAEMARSRDLQTRPGVAAALGDGSVTVEQAGAIGQALGRIARVPGVTPAEQEEAAQFLLGQAAALGPADLVLVGRQLEETLTRLPSVDDPADADAVRRERERAERAAQARERNGFRFSRARDGRCRATLDLGPVGEAFARAWAKQAGRPAPGSDGFEDHRDIAERRGDALVDLLAEAAAAARTGRGRDTAPSTEPSSDADPATDDEGQADTGPFDEESDMAADPDLFGHDADPADEPAGTVTMIGRPPRAVLPVALLNLTVSLAELRTGLTGAGTLETGATVSAATLRRLACDALVVPAVLGGPSDVLDLGRARRLHTPAQRRAITLRDRACITPGCHRPPRDCHVHHDPPWEAGGPTDVQHGYLACGFHHQRFHQQGWTIRLAANGYPELIPPKTIDPQQRPRQHARFQLQKPPRRC